MDLKFHTSCSTLPVKNFYMANLTGDLRHLIVGYKEEDAKKYIDHKECDQGKEALRKVLEHHSILTRDKKQLQIRKLEYEYKWLMGQMVAIQKILDLYDQTGVMEFLELLSEVGIKYQVGDNIDKVVDKSIRKSKLLKNQLQIKKLKIEKLAGYDPEATKPEPEEVIAQLDKTAVSIEANLKLGYQLKPDEISAERWFNLLQTVKEQQKQMT